MRQPAIFIDWGTTNFRAWLLDTVSGEVLDAIERGKGMASLPRDGFAAYCASRIAPWRAGDAVPVYMAGMVGADQGWKTAPQLPLPVSCAGIAAEVVSAPGLENAWIVPGARVPGETPDVMRGEEVQIFGALALAGTDNGVLCLPGTHSKWARVENGALSDFSTVMTGEVFGLLRNQSILARSLPADGPPASFDAAAFERGLRKARDSGGLLNQIFSVRSLFLQGSLAATGAADYLSGILIGQEIIAMAGRYPAGPQDLLLVAGDDLLERYRIALSQAGFGLHCVSAREASLAGMRQVMQVHQARL
ncbi:2-dehydro-3-deoxygalactonokinase [Granulosicoccaceae sp. 1_MG-2023]|nr:2-dehydro-3-deoxygalactonokinase [Granulosicoccaceae sp. 1_MG-2023]